MAVVGDGTWDIPDLEALLRNVLRATMTAEFGSDWQGQLPLRIRKLIADAAKLARRKRPHERLLDDWDAAGMLAIRAVLDWRVPAVLQTVWPDKHYAEVDLSRIVAARDKRAHVVGPPLGELVDQESRAIVSRLRIGLEDVRRQLDDQEGDWWPYIAALHSNIDSLCWERSSGWAPGPDVVNEGDLLTFDVVGMNPTGPDEDLRYDYRFIQPGGVQGAIPWDEASSARLEVPLCKSILVKISLGTTYDLANVDSVKRQLRVRPRR